MLIKRKNQEKTGNWAEHFENGGFCKVRLYITRWGSFHDIYQSVEITSKSVFDSMEKQNHHISIEFDNSTVIEMPIEGFINMFELVPEGELTNALYGN